MAYDGRLGDFLNVGLSDLDVLALLPESAALRLRGLRDRKADAMARIPPGYDVQQAHMEVLVAERRLETLLGGPLPLHQDDNRCVVQRRLIKERQDTHASLTRRYKVNAEEAQGVGRALITVESWIKNRPGGAVIEQVTTSVPSLLKGETLIEGVARLRRKAVEIKEALAVIERAPRPSSEVKALAKAEIEKLAKAPDVRGLFQGGTPNWPTESLTTKIFNVPDRAAVGFASAVDGLALTCWLHKDALIAAINREIDAHAHDDIAMSPSAKERAVAEMAKTLLDLEHAICRMVDVGLAQKLPLEYGDEDPAAMLGVTLRTVPPPSPQQGSSPERTGYNVRR